MYLPISRKYRPQSFEEIVGQEHITTTLKNAIASDKVAHAYLFAGSRGIGKTSTARVFAKALNCEKGPSSKSCNKCIACQEISKGISLDVLEIDGASNRGIDEIRNLRENVKLKPIYGKYKIYIIDEVHMLTPEAFNALLKTLEEPPPHVKFIFATTRPYKILPTIVSRCQRFDFHTISTPIIVETLKHIARTEKLNIEDDALFLIAKNSEGSLRDAQVMLDQLASYSKGRIKGRDVSDMLGVLEQEMLIRMSEAILAKDGGAILDMIDGFINKGKDALFIASSLIEHFRNLMVVSSCKDSSAHIVLDEEDRKRLEEISHKFSIEELFYIVSTLSHTVDLISKTSLGKIPLEIALLKISNMDKFIPVSELIKKLEKLGNVTKNSVSEIYSREIVGPKVSDGGISNTSYDAPPHIAEEVLLPQKNEPASRNSAESGPVPQEQMLLRLKGIWPEIIRAVKAKKMSVGSYLEEGMLLDIKEEKVIIGFSRSNSLHKEALEANNNHEVISKVIKEFMEKDLKVNFVFSEINDKKEKPAGDYSPPEPDAVQVSKKIEPIVRSAIDKFNAKIIKQYYIKEEK